MQHGPSLPTEPSAFERHTTAQDGGTSSEMLAVTPRAHKESLAHSTCLSAGDGSSQLRGHSPSAHLTVCQHPCQPLPRSHSRSQPAGSADMGGLAQESRHDSLSRSARHTTRLAVFSVNSSFKAASGVRPSDESACIPECIAEQAPSHSEDSPNSALDPVDRYVAAVCVFGARAVPATRRRAGARSSLQTVHLTADDVNSICHSVKPESATPQEPDVVVHVNVAPSPKAATFPGSSLKTTCREKPPNGATPTMIHELVKALVEFPQRAEVMHDDDADVRACSTPGNTAELAAGPWHSPTVHPSMLQHIYSASPEQPRTRAPWHTGHGEMEHSSAMSLYVARVEQAQSAVLSQAAGAEGTSSQDEESCCSDTVSIRSNSIQPADSSRAISRGQASESIADSAWLNMAPVRKEGSSGLLHADSSSAWVCKHRRAWGSAFHRQDSVPAVHVASAALTDGSGQSIGSQTRSYQRQDPRHMFNGTHPAESGTAMPASESAAPGARCRVASNRPHHNGNRDPDGLDMQVGGKAGSMMLPLPPMMSMFL